MSTDLFSPRFRLRRARFPRIRPSGGPFGFVDGVGWLAPGLLWVDGWLSIDPATHLDVGFELAGEPLRRRARCFTAAPFAEEDGLAARRWCLVVPVGPDLVTASRLQNLTLTTPWGELVWLGACDRLVAADVARQLRHPRMPLDHLERLLSFLDMAVRSADGDVNHPLFRRNLAALRRATEQDDPLTDVVARGEAEIAWMESFGELPRKPRISVIVTLLHPPDLLDHHFAQQRRSRGDLDGETIFVVGPRNASPELTWRLNMLTDLYDLPTLLLELKQETTWTAAAALGARHARGDILAFYKEQAFSFESGGLAALVAPLGDEAPTGITAPIVRHFDGSVRSHGFRLSAGKVARLETIDLSDADPARRNDLAACTSECFAIRRSLFERLGGFAGAFVHDDFESIDLCLRAAAAGAPVQAVGRSVTCFVESARRPPVSRGPLTDHADYETLYQRHFSTPVTTAGPSPAGSPPTATVVIPTLNPGRELADVLDRLEAQEGAALEQIVVIDSSSNDGTRRLLQRRGVEHQVIARHDFNHGLTRNLGLQQARGDVVAFLSQDALPEPGWLAALLAAFDDSSVAGAYSRQVARDGASAFAVDRLSHWPASGAEPRRQLLPPTEIFEAMSLTRRLETVCFDNVSSAVRRAVALDVPFRDLPFGEDRDWAYRAMAAGYSIRYCADSKVIHSHDRSAWLDLRRTVIDHRLIYEMLSNEAEKANGGSIVDLLPAARRELMRLLDVATAAPTAWRRLSARSKAPAHALVGVLGPYLGSRIAHYGAAGSRKWSWVGRVLAR